MNYLSRYLKIILLVTLIITQQSFGQKPVVGIKAGIALSKSEFNYVYTSNSYKTLTRNGFLFGLYVDVSAGKFLSFRPGIELVPKGDQQNGYPNRFYYLDIPLNILYKKNYTQGSLMMGGGPSIGIPTNEKSTVKTDVGLNALIGYEFPIGFSFNVNYTYGLINVSRDKQYISNIKNRYFGITVGYSF